MSKILPNLVRSRQISPDHPISRQILLIFGEPGRMSGNIVKPLSNLAKPRQIWINDVNCRKILADLAISRRIWRNIVERCQIAASIAGYLRIFPYPVRFAKSAQIPLNIA